MDLKHFIITVLSPFRMETLLLARHALQIGAVSKSFFQTRDGAACLSYWLTDGNAQTTQHAISLAPNPQRFREFLWLWNHHEISATMLLDLLSEIVITKRRLAAQQRRGNSRKGTSLNGTQQVRGKVYFRDAQSQAIIRACFLPLEDHHDDSASRLLNHHLSQS